MALTFWGKSRVDKSVHPHESGLSMTIPLMVLALLSVIGGWVGIPHAIGEYLGHIPNFWEHWLEPVIRKLPAVGAVEASHDVTTEWLLMGISVVIAACSAGLAYWIYIVKPGTSEKVKKSIRPVYEFVNKKYLVDEAYFAGIINPLVQASRNLWYYVDVNFIDKLTFKAADVAMGGGSFVRALQNGNMQQYAMYIGVGVVVVLSFVLMG